MSIDPSNKESSLSFFLPDFKSGETRPFVSDGIAAGFPSPAQDFLGLEISLDQALTKNKAATFYAKVKGNSMTGAGIDDGDILVIDRSLEPHDNKIAVCCIDGEFTVKRIKIDVDCVYLMPENSAFQPIKVTDENQLIIWGMVTYVIKAV